VRAARKPMKKTSQELAAATLTSSRLITALRDPSCYPHPVRRVDVIETHISWVLLTGDYAYKIKKPVTLGFLDFSSLEARRHYCNEELRLNRRTAPQLYLDVVPISGSVSRPAIGGVGNAFEYAVRMRQFPEDALLDRMARSATLQPYHLDRLAQLLAEFHSQIGRASADTAFGSSQCVLDNASRNFSEIEALAPIEHDLQLLRRLRDWTRNEHASLSAVLDARKQGGFVRECHGDLHLGNIALIDGVPTPFDCIEFNADFRWIDVMNEIAFLVMDLLDHRLPRLAFRFLNAYLEITGDYAGVRVLRFYLVYRALVRAKVACIRAQQPGIGNDDKRHAEQIFRNRLQLAQRLAAWSRPALIIMHGLAGSGKTTVSQALLESFGAIRLRSDIERKRLHGLKPALRTGSGIEAGIYAAGATESTYDQLAHSARELLMVGYPVIVDATFLKHAHRDAFRMIASGNGVPFAIASCVAKEAALRERVVKRDSEGKDASEAGVAVLERQLATQDPLAKDESELAIVFNRERGDPLPDKALQELARRLGIEVL
jgi:aminoglycoside phosphotransferase family enzyme/predicted kinase